jgi:hypothetical protein
LPGTTDDEISVPREPEAVMQYSERALNVGCVLNEDVDVLVRRARKTLAGVAVSDSC